ncbi:MAG: NnrU family protein [Pseudomonadales bacterium]
MTMLILGVVLFFTLHMMPFWMRGFRSTVIKTMGAGPYAGVFALLSLASFVVIVFGWKAAELSLLYVPPAWGRHATMLLVLVGILLFIASNAPTNIRRVLRHPQLLGVSLWGIGHLLSNGETRSAVLFGGMILFSVVAMWSSNKRDGEWEKREAVPVSRDVVVVLIGLVVFSALLYFHQSFTGMPVTF